MNEENSQGKRLFVGLAVGAIFGLGVGLLVGLVFAYGIAPLEWTDAGPQDMREDYGAYYWELVAESYAKHGNVELAKKQLGEWDEGKKLQSVLDRARIESSPELKMVLDSLEKKVIGAAPDVTAPGQTPATEAETGRAGISLLAILGVLLLVLIALFAIAMFVSRMRKREEPVPGLEMVEPEPEWLAPLRTEEGVPTAPPLAHFVTSYTLGNDNYDDSFSIETSAGEFLGECGVGISETIGEGDPDKVTAFEVWLFDKNDIRTITKVMMSEYAFNDEELRASLATKGEAVLARANDPIVLETATLRVEATATEATYGTGALPSNSFFDRLTVDLAAYQKEPAAGPSPSDEPEFEL